jgi:ATP-dependent helicase/nuclease subunit B
MESIADELSETYGEGTFSDSARQRAHLGRMKKVLRSTAAAIARQMSRGDFELKGAEVFFGKDGDYPPIVLKEPNGTQYEINGFIDRVDKSRENEGYIRVVDYKSGGKDFKFAKLFEGVDLQLPMYLSAALAAEPESNAAGFYYMPVKKPCVDEKDAAKLDQKIAESLRLTGLTAGCIDIDNSIVKPAVVTPEQMKEVLDFALSKAAQTLKKIRNGDIGLRPFKFGYESACKYCEYRDACGFDLRNPKCNHRAVKNLKQNEFFEKLIPTRPKGEDHGENELDR